MSSEGELKKQIQDVISGKHAKNGIWYDKEIHAVLEVAKLDAPALNMNLNKNGYFYVGEWIAWFEKWFGSADK